MALFIDGTPHIIVTLSSVLNEMSVFFCHEHDAVDKDSYATWTTFSWRLIKEKYKDRLNGTPFVIKIPRFSLSIYKLQFWCNYILTASLCSSIIRLGCTNTFVPIYFVQHALDCPFLVGGRDVIKTGAIFRAFWSFIHQYHKSQASPCKSLAHAASLHFWHLKNIKSKGYPSTFFLEIAF